MMSDIHILVAEDDMNIRMGLVDTLESESYMVTEAINGIQALELFRQRPFDLVLLDIMMPEKSGYDVCRDIRGMDENVPIIMLTAKGEEMDKVVGLHLGADDYITKPFGIHELLARIAAVLRRSRLNRPKESVPPADTFTFGNYQVNEKTFKMTWNARDNADGEENPVVEIDLSEREIKLIRHFHNHPGEVLSRDNILNEIWGIDYLGTTRTLDQHIAKLRKKIEKDPSCPSLITTVHGVGYRYAAL